ncbi:MAG: hypothetical protein AAFU53_06865 [Cyanobacteria bacterium J06632_3]
MRYNPQHTVDVSAAEPNEFSLDKESRSLTIGEVVSQSIGVDLFALFASLMLGVLLSSAVGAVELADGIDRFKLVPPRWLVFVISVLPALLWLLLDGLSALSNPVTLPFARSRLGMKAVYAKRIHILLLFFYFSSILVALCWSAVSMLLMSKIFVAAVFAIALFALGQSIPSRRMSFIVSGILFLVVLVATQAFIVLKLEADSVRANQEALDGLGVPDAPGIFEEEADESFFEERGE